MIFVLEMPLLFILIYILFKRKVKSLHIGFTYSIITLFLYIFFATELLSLLSKVNVYMIVTVWTLVLILLFFVNRNHLKSFIKGISKSRYPKLLGYEKTLGFFWAFFLLLTFFMSLFTVVNNGDSMIYHLPRVLHWLQDETVNYYYVQDNRQIFSPVLAEYTLTHIYALSGNDVLFNLLQWFAYAIVSIYVYLICRSLNITKQNSMIGVLLFLTMPMALAQSITTQVDLVGTMWVVIFIYLMIDIAKKEHLLFNREDIFEMCMAACCVGLAYITKTNACVPMSFVCIWFLLSKLKRKEKVVSLVRFAVTAIVIAILILLPGLIRNLMYAGSFFPSEFSEKVLILTMNPKYVFVNIYKNISMELMQYCLVDVDSRILYLGSFLAGKLRLDINDPLIGYGGNDYLTTGSASYYYFHHDHASNPIVMLMAIWSMVYITVVIIRNRKKSNSDLAVGLSIAVVLGFIASTAIIRWQPWVTRLLLPSQVTLIIPIVYSLQRLLKKVRIKEYLVGMMTFAMLIMSVNSIFYNIRVPLKNIFSSIDRTGLYFYYHEDEYDGYRAVIDEIIDQGYHNIGLGTLHFEYVLWKELKENGCTLEHISLEDGKDYGFSPDCIVVFNQYEDGDIVMFNEEEYRYNVLYQSDTMSYGLLAKESEI